MGNKQKQTLLDVSMELKMTSRQLERQSQKLEQGERGEMTKIKQVSTTTVYSVVNSLLIRLNRMHVGFGQKSNGKRKNFRRERHQE